MEVSAPDSVGTRQEAVVQCLDCMHDQPHLSLAFYEEDGRRISRIEGAARGSLAITSLAEESRPPAAADDEGH